jgi:thiol-disulfide isomerase/thioredoxin
MIPARAGFMVLALTVGGCAAQSPTPEATRQAYRAAVITSAGDEIPFFLELPLNCNTGRAAVINGIERISVPCQRIGPRLLIDFLVYGTRITAERSDNGTLSGYWGHTGGHVASNERLRFDARPLSRIDAASRFLPTDLGTGTTARPADVGGIWRVEFESRDLAKAVLEVTDGGVVKGSAEVPSEYGDLRFLAGNVHGSSLSLSTFDGAGAYLIRGELDADRRLKGELIRADGTRDPFTAVRSADFDVVDPLQRVRVTSAEKRLDLAPLLNSRYAGKAVIVELFGTWCSNCNDLAPLLAELYTTHHAEGLEILSVAYEISADETYVRERVAEYKAAHGVLWEVMIPSAPPEELLSAGPARLSSISGVPVTLFFNRDRTVRAIYTGFSGPATGASHERAAATFRQLTKEILTSR